MTKIAIIVGSSRIGSYNQKLADLSAEALTSHGAEVTRIDLETLNLPLYSDERELKDFPVAARELKALLQAQSGLLIASPEFNGSVSPLLKNAIDWASRPTDGEGLTALTAYRGKVAAMAAASISPFGGLRGLIHLRQILSTIQMLVLPEQVMLPNAHMAFDEVGGLKDGLAAALVDLQAKRLVEVASVLSA